MHKRFMLVLMTGLLALSAATMAGCSEDEGDRTPASTPTEATQPEATQPEAAAPTKPSAPSGMKDVAELKIEDLTVGTGAEAVIGKQVTVHYTGWLVDGTEFDSSLNSGQPFTFALGSGMVIPGWDQGVAGMKVGGTRMLTIPPSLGYGEAGGGPIPPNSTLVFQVELVGVQ